MVRLTLRRGLAAVASMAAAAALSCCTMTRGLEPAGHSPSVAVPVADVALQKRSARFLGLWAVTWAVACLLALTGCADWLLVSETTTRYAADGKTPQARVVRRYPPTYRMRADGSAEPDTTVTLGIADRAFGAGAGLTRYAIDRAIPTPAPGSPARPLLHQPSS